MSDKSWGHYLFRVAEDEIVREEVTQYRWRHRCRVSRTCVARTAYLIGYRYITGRMGRTTTREQVACAEHARVFAEKHGLAFPLPDDSPTCSLYGGSPRVYQSSEPEGK